ncbi:MAG: YHS domain-containing protein [Cyclobacteriaceae bacterium]
MMILAVLISAFSLLQSSHINTDRKGLALQGYDPVSYFSGEPIKGLAEIEFAFQGTKYYFSSADNKETFSKNPSKYAPQYGGWCAYAMGLGTDKVKINPMTYKVVEGKLYLFYDFKGTNTLVPWNENEGSLMKEANKNWEKITK